MQQIIKRVLFAAAVMVAVFLPFGQTVKAESDTKVVVRENGEYDVYYLETNDESEILKSLSSQLKLSPYDKAELKRRGDNFTLQIDRAYEVYVESDGYRFAVKMMKETVQTAISRLGLGIGAEDIVSLPLDYVMKPGETVTIQRVTYRVTKTTSSVAYASEYVKTPCLADGKSVLLIPGKDGSVAHTVTERLVDGVVESSSSVDEVISEASPALYLVGDSSLGYHQTQIPSFLTLDKNGVPTEYKYVLTGKGTAYTANAGAKTSTGAYAVVGRVAVDPKEIPYGSLLYITSADGKFVYGIAIASDTGSALYNGNVLVDLYFDTLAECYTFGARTMNVYVIA